MRASPSTAVRLSAGLACASLVLLSAAPGLAADPVARASAAGAVITIGGTPTDSGTYTATNDGTRETTTGANAPALGLLGGQDALSVGTVAQDATTSVVDGRGRSAACAGIAGDGATVAAAGEGSCLTPGDNATLNAGTLDLSDLTIVQGDLATLPPELDSVSSMIIEPAQDALQEVLDTLGDPGIVVDLGAVQSQCTAGPRTADGTSRLTDVEAYLQLPDRRVALVSLPTDPAPNTKVVTGLDEVVTLVTDALEEQLETGLDGVLDPLEGATDQIAQQLNDTIVAVVAQQLAPLEENLLDGTLNKQVRNPGAIEVTALDLRVLPAAAEFGVEALTLELGRSACGPSDRVAAPDSTPSPDPTPTPRPTVPTSVPAGIASAAPDRTDAGSVNGWVATGGLAALVALATGAGVATYRRSLRG